MYYSSSQATCARSEFLVPSVSLAFHPLEGAFTTTPCSSTNTRTRFVRKSIVTMDPYGITNTFPFTSGACSSMSVTHSCPVLPTHSGHGPWAESSFSFLSTAAAPLARPTFIVTTSAFESVDETKASSGVGSGRDSTGSWQRWGERLWNAHAQLGGVTSHEVGGIDPSRIAYLSMNRTSLVTSVAKRLAYLGLYQPLLKCLDAEKRSHDHSNGRNERLGEKEHHGYLPVSHNALVCLLQAAWYDCPSTVSFPLHFVSFKPQRFRVGPV
jgi:hypothetical protein